MSEISQIAGRAGRHINDGTFGITGECKQLSSDEIEKLENGKERTVLSLKSHLSPIKAAVIPLKRNNQDLVDIVSLQDLKPVSILTIVRRFVTLEIK